MNTILYYFSGTGNSLVIARDLAAALVNTTLIAIPRALQEPVAGAADAAAAVDAVGIVFPVYAWGPPRIVTDFINSRTWNGIPYLFAVCTCGGFPGGTLTQVERALRARGGNLSAGFSIVMPGNYTALYGAIAEAKQQKLFARARARVAEIAELIKARRNRPVEKSFLLVNWLTGLLYKFGMPKFKTADTKFWVMDTCTHCGLCVKVCPRLNIDLQDDRPQWHGNCEQCMACLQWCPVEAIQFSRATQKRKRYHHPAIKAKDLFIKQGN
ncbi:MAG: 4Fe-4S dicluster domain-containing protein [Verrucomicrobia bacterium]|nr:4Fe-4S dicluster domain-containing protein [Verrucomicrobiota bacterium]MBU4285371.1 4Fe-4S dicluster domain-containing protein [Verrucomicrobiota bacterium]MBU4365945.1 4Fe-4S dicluster domain-containing protein [Verrucomicrobiota bacterium]